MKNFGSAEMNLDGAFRPIGRTVEYREIEKRL
jgi:hypothetical protein